MTRYFDSSALLKLVVDEPESERLRGHLEHRPLPARTSIIAATETTIAAFRHGAADAGKVSATPGWVMTPSIAVLAFAVTPRIADRAAHLGARHGLRTLDAIHVATADLLGPQVRELVTYDHRMKQACAALGIRIASPGRSDL